MQKKANDSTCKKTNTARELAIGNFDDSAVIKSCIENFAHKVLDYYWFYA